MGKLEKNSAKRKKILALELNDDEWERVGIFCDLLSASYFFFLNARYDIHNFIQHADTAQQAFSADKSPSLHDALPAIEALHAAWSKRSSKEKYSPFWSALNAATTKLDEYYTKTSASDAHIMAMGL